MQTNVETRVEHTLTVRMTETEWHAVLDSPKDFIAEIRKELAELKFARPGPEGAKSRANASKRVGSKKVHRASNSWICPGCGRELKGKQGSYHHLKLCKAGKSIVPDATSSSRPETASPTDESTAASASGN